MEEKDAEKTVNVVNSAKAAEGPKGLSFGCTLTMKIGIGDAAAVSAEGLRGHTNRP